MQPLENSNCSVRVHLQLVVIASRVFCFVFYKFFQCKHIAGADTLQTSAAH